METPSAPPEAKQEPVWKAEAEKEWQDYLQDHSEVVTPERDAKLLSKLLTHLLGIWIEATSGTHQMEGLMFRLERNPPEWMGKEPVAVIVSACPICGQEALQEAGNLLAIGAALAGQVPNHDCRGPHSRTANRNAVEQRLLDALRDFMQS